MGCNLRNVQNLIFSTIYISNTIITQNIYSNYLNIGNKWKIISGFREHQREDAKQITVAVLKPEHLTL